MTSTTASWERTSAHVTRLVRASLSRTSRLRPAPSASTRTPARAASHATARAASGAVSRSVRMAAQIVGQIAPRPPGLTMSWARPETRARSGRVFGRAPKSIHPMEETSSMSEATAATTTAPGGEEVLERARQLQDLLARNAAETDRVRRIPDESLAALTDAGLFRLTAPRRVGGFEPPLRPFLGVAAVLGG